MAVPSSATIPPPPQETLAFLSSKDQVSFKPVTAAGWENKLAKVDGAIPMASTAFINSGGIRQFMKDKFTWWFSQSFDVSGDNIQPITLDSLVHGMHIKMNIRFNTTSFYLQIYHTSTTDFAKRLYNNTYSPTKENWEPVDPKIVGNTGQMREEKLLIWYNNTIFVKIEPVSGKLSDCWDVISKFATKFNVYLTCYGPDGKFVDSATDFVTVKTSSYDEAKKTLQLSLEPLKIGTGWFQFIVYDTQSLYSRTTVLGINVTE
ncbi:hypothetical protein B0T24DRAFT_598003 [Lasiosphaeria ovina]|uniref:Uncharacterized protein n=1 Tax=Lasiosphaeria ovina TaxID=92902 RepID=A0AAE0N127_9PEZI|nr:hypothetical protein B0T24DRAFT_598003 [Lasiosphaeria ovina]